MKKNENSEELGQLGRFLARVLWVCMILAAVAFVALAAYGLCATAAALGRNEAWAEWVACILFLVAFMLMLCEMNK